MAPHLWLHGTYMCYLPGSSINAAACMAASDPDRQKFNSMAERLWNLECPGAFVNRKRTIFYLI